MSDKLKLVVNKGISPDSPLPKLKSIRVKDSRSAKRLLSRLITQMQRGEILPEDAKDLTYLLSTFINIVKFTAEESEVEKIVNEKLQVYLRQLTAFSDQFFKEFETTIPKEKLEEFQKKFNAIAKKFNQDAKEIRLQILKEIREKTSLKPKSKSDTVDPEYAIASTMNYLRSLPDEVFHKVMTAIQAEYFN